MIFFPLLQLADYRNPSDVAYQNVANSIRSIQLRVAGPATNLEGAVRQTLSSIDPNLVVQDMMSLEEQVGISFNNPRLTARITGLYGLLALLVASVGLYGVAAYTVARRTSEIGIRIALGANRTRVVLMVLRNAMLPIMIGLVIGIPAAVLGGRAMASQLYGVTGYDPLVLTTAAVVLAVCALVAGIIPARRAATVDPIRALRTD
jgi:ABC-type antimicrobial peptide transport system permease subunit